MAGLLSGALFSAKIGSTEVRGIYGGPSLVGTAQADTALPAAVRMGDPVLGGTDAIVGQDEGGVPPADYDDGAVKSEDSFSGPMIPQPASAAILETDSAPVSGQAAVAALPDLNADFVMPTHGHDWGILHNYNAIDIANSCGTPIVAAADGLVVPDRNIPDVLGGWNGGYGNFILIEHPFGNNVFTRYAHLEKMTVQIGDYVKQGQEIGLMGETGDATGCHLHFEVIGAENPFAKQ